ncbi:LysR substrate-binding domain-containing protein [Paenibacillus sp. WLX2291]|uniref:LysR family transcriptional regulator n=1 Tax=Paenibacillus sp. WLX2291 TaxID=3296934 RepID=UPI0039841D82
MIVETLRVFVTVAEQLNFSRAAELLNLSQPGVSLHIRNLENEFGATLMHRSPKMVKLTEAGDILYRRAKEILLLHEAAKQDIMRLHDKVTGSLHIGASFTIGEYVLPRMLATFAMKYPQADIELTIGNTAEIIQAVQHQRLDLGLVEGEVWLSSLHIRPYAKDEMIIIAAANHPLAALRVVDTTNLNNQVWVLREPGSGTRAFSDRLLDTTGCTPKKTYVFNSSQGVKEAVLAGLGISMLSRCIVQKELEQGELVELVVKGIQQERNFSLITSPEMASTRVHEVFIEQLFSSSL